MGGGPSEQSAPRRGGQARCQLGCLHLHPDYEMPLEQGPPESLTDLLVDLGALPSLPARKLRPGTGTGKGLVSDHTAGGGDGAGTQPPDSQPVPRPVPEQQTMSSPRDSA